MKKSLARAVGTACFFLVGVLLFTGIGEVLRRKTSAETDQVHSYYAMEEGTLDVLFLGSSHLYYGVQANELWKNQGIASYVMGTPEQTAATSYYLLKEALRTQKPKVVAMESYYLWYNKLYKNEARLRQAFDGAKFSSVKVEMVNTMLPEAGFKEKLSYYLPFLKYHSRWDSLENYDFHTSPYLKGSRLDFTAVSLEDPGVPEAAGLPELSREYLEKIIALCEEEGIAFVMFAIPFGVEYDLDTYNRRQGLNLTLERFLEEKGVPFLYYQRDYGEVIDFSADFRDKTHLNTSGAEKLTAHLGEWLQEEYSLPDHRGESGYEAWDHDLELYEAAKAEARTNPEDTADNAG